MLSPTEKLVEPHRPVPCPWGCERQLYLRPNGRAWRLVEQNGALHRRHRRQRGRGQPAYEVGKG